MGHCGRRIMQHRRNRTVGVLFRKLVDVSEPMGEPTSCWKNPIFFTFPNETATAEFIASASPNCIFEDFEESFVTSKGIKELWYYRSFDDSTPKKLAFSWGKFVWKELLSQLPVHSVRVLFAPLFLSILRQQKETCKWINKGYLSNELPSHRTRPWWKNGRFSVSVLGFAVAENPLDAEVAR